MITSLQQLYDTCRDNLKAMKHRAINLDGECAYRGDDGCKCIVGALIPDEIYQPTMEGQGPGLRGNGPLSIALRSVVQVPEEDIDAAINIMAEFQTEHDEYFNWTPGEGFHNWPAINKIATDYGLTA